MGVDEGGNVGKEDAKTGCASSSPIPKIAIARMQVRMSGFSLPRKSGTRRLGSEVGHPSDYSQLIA
jgi:hypothetical protein